MNELERELRDLRQSPVVQPVDDGAATRRRILRTLEARTVLHARLKAAAIVSGVVTSTALAWYLVSSSERAQRMEWRAPARELPALQTSAPELSTPEQPKPSADAAASDVAAPALESRAASPAHPTHPSAGESSTARRPPTGQAQAKTRGDRTLSGPRGTSGGPAPNSSAPSAAPRFELAVPQPNSTADAPPRVQSPAPHATPAAVAPPPRAAPGAPQGDAAFWAVYRLQFSGPPQRALQAWDSYLARGPSAELAIEARYHRAVIMLRLGRYAEARPELERFAAGGYAGTHADDARRLLAQLATVP